MEHEAVAEAVTPGECEKVGVPMPDIAGVGIVLAFTVQAAISLVLALWVNFLSHFGRLDTKKHEEGTVEHTIALKRLESCLDVIMAGNDVQVLTGLALMVTAFISSAALQLDLYHLHLIYDTVCFTGVSNAAALVTWTFCASKHPKAHTSPYWKKTPWGGRILTARHRATYLFAMVFLALTILLGVRLREWSTKPDAPLGKCFRSDGVLAVPGASHPSVDRLWVGVTAAWMLVVLLFAVFDGPARRRKVLLLASAQFPVHLYAVIALRTANQAYLGEEGEAGTGESENSWDFGQTTAVLLLLVTVHEIVTKAASQWKFERDLKADRKRKQEGGWREGDGQVTTEQLKVAPQLEAAESLLSDGAQKRQ